MSDDGLFELAPRPAFEPGDRVDLHTLWGIHHGIVAEVYAYFDGTHELVLAIDGVKHTVDPTHCTYTAEEIA